MWNLTGDNATRKSSRSLLPVLTILFLVSYGLLTMLVVEQGRTIDSQRNLIHLLFSDSVQLSSIKGKAAQKQNDAQAQARAQAQKKSPPAQAAPSDPRTSASSAAGRARKIRAPANSRGRFRRDLRKARLTRETIAGR